MLGFGEISPAAVRMEFENVERVEDGTGWEAIALMPGNGPEDSWSVVANVALVF